MTDGRKRRPAADAVFYARKCIIPAPPDVYKETGMHGMPPERAVRPAEGEKMQTEHRNTSENTDAAERAENAPEEAGNIQRYTGETEDRTPPPERKKKRPKLRAAVQKYPELFSAVCGLFLLCAAALVFSCRPAGDIGNGKTPPSVHHGNLVSGQCGNIPAAVYTAAEKYYGKTPEDAGISCGLAYIPFPENPSTGYSLVPSVRDPETAEEITGGGLYFQQKTDPEICGAPGTEVFVVRGLRSGKTEVTFSEYAPGQYSKGIPENTYTAELVCGKNGKLISAVCSGIPDGQNGGEN